MAAMETLQDMAFSTIATAIGVREIKEGKIVLTEKDKHILQKWKQVAWNQRVKESPKLLKATGTRTLYFGAGKHSFMDEKTDRDVTPAEYEKKYMSFIREERRKGDLIAKSEIPHTEGSWWRQEI
jgi:hypothetical protein